MKRLLPLLLLAAPLHAQSFLAPPHPLFGETGRIHASKNPGGRGVQFPSRRPPAGGGSTLSLSLSSSGGGGSSGGAGLGGSVSANYTESTLRAPPLGVD